jgi:hypothetical protein
MPPAKIMIRPRLVTGVNMRPAAEAVGCIIDRSQGTEAGILAKA